MNEGKMKVCLGENNQITLPDEVIKTMNLSLEDEFIVTMNEGHIELIPAISIPKDEAYLFTPYWQNALQQAEKDMVEGDLENAENVNEMFRKLEEE